MSNSTHLFCQDGFQIQGVVLGVLKKRIRYRQFLNSLRVRELIEFAVFLGISLSMLLSAFVVTLSFYCVLEK